MAIGVLFDYDMTKIHRIRYFSLSLFYALAPQCLEPCFLILRMTSRKVKTPSIIQHQD
ncbi:hypothetical protein OR16_41289 [Cupriavidus basilensis OR16]|uniref:Uncharacterized protein n=1 Tax=Cupriavidus basilensis OR16 TaxID=1127483 RepID=H1SID7_9BURK|nr:hypothetical protein OR16_41289 [Cupriavidus basilensis OR16]